MELYESICSLMNFETLKDFGLGGGTNLALKYDHRISTDIDLFSQHVVGSITMIAIAEELETKIPGAIIQPQNITSDNLSFLRGVIPYYDQVRDKEEYIKIDIMQNMKFQYDLELKDGVRLISDNDIGSLKILSAAGRGTRKDFYDLALLTEIEPLEQYYDILIQYFEKAKDTQENNFEYMAKQKGVVQANILKDLSPLINFNGASLESEKNNQIRLTANPKIKLPENWQKVKNLWKNRVESFAKSRGIKCIHEPVKRKSKNRGIGF